MHSRHEAFINEAIRLRQKYAGKIKILIGFEAEWIRPSYATLVQELASNSAVDFFVGSVHHVNEIPIDFDNAFYELAREKAGGTDQRIFEDYFDSQFEMLKTLKPVVVGHFDLIRLLSDEPDRDLKHMAGIWEKIIRNLNVVVGYGGLLEINTSALRKGLKEPYPGRAICEEFLSMGGKLTLSDDSHGTAQVGTNFGKAFEYLDSLGVQEMWTLEPSIEGAGEKKIPEFCKVELKTIKKSFKA